MSKNVFIFSVPRSGSTWYSKRMSKLLGMNLISEPFRVLIGGDSSSKLHHTQRLTESDFNSDSFWSGVPKSEKVIFDGLIQWLNSQQDVIVKETNGTMQLGFYKKALPEYRFVYLKRHPLAVLDSHIRIPDVIKSWHYLERISRHRQYCDSQYQTIYNRADGVKIRNSSEYALLFAHIYVQSLILDDVVGEQVVYEDIVDQGIYHPDNLRLFDDRPMLDLNALSLDQQKTVYTIHGTKNPTNPYRWVEKFNNDDWQAVQRIVGDECSAMVDDDIRAKHKHASFVPPLSYTICSSISALLTNRLITTSDFTDFLNVLVKEGVDELEKRLAFSESQHTLYFKDGLYHPRRPNAPIVLISPLAALAFARFQGSVLPSKNAYLELSKVINQSKIEACGKNYGELVGTTTRVGQYDDVLGYYDLIGNVRELCLSDDRLVYVGGGSFKDEESDLSLSRFTEIPIFYRDLDIGFRLQHSSDTFSKPDLVSMIRDSSDQMSLFDNLL